MSQRNGSPLFSNVDWEQSVGYMKTYLEDLKEYPIHTLLDLGAAKGHFSMMFENVFDATGITMVEANPLSCAELEYLPYQVINTAIGKPGTATFYTNPTEQTGGGSSLFKENTEHFNDAIAQTVDVVSLDSLGISADMIKIDVQGAELDVLKYGKETVSKANFLVLELSLMEYNTGAPLIDDVLELTRELGFRIVDVFGPNRGGHYYKGKKVQVDVILAREPHKMV